MSLAKCLKKLKLSSEAAAEIKKEAKRYQKAGLEQAQAETKAVSDAIDDAQGNIEDLRSQLARAGHSVDLVEISPQVTEDALKAKPLEGGTVYQSGDEYRGMVEFYPEGAIITLFEKADQSTFLHESSHIWLRHLFEMAKSGQMDEATRTDWETLSQWLGVQDGQDRLTDEQQERFADAFEAYLIKGEEPSPYLKKAFHALSRWLTNIYRHATDAKVEIPAEIKGVLDRMLATEDEIAAAESDLSFDFQLKDEELAPEAKAELADMREMAKSEAYDILLKSHMAELALERQQVLAASRAKARIEAEKEVSALPIYGDMAVVEDAFKEPAAALAKKYLDGKLEPATVTEFDAHADLMGYTSGDHMAKAFASATPKIVEVGRRVEAAMGQFEALKDREAVKAEAAFALHNEKSLELLAFESELLKSLEGVTDSKEAKKKINRAKVRHEVIAARDQAREILSAKSVRDATAFTHFFAAERQAAVKVAKAVAAKDYYWAATYKKQQMVSHALAMESIKLKREMDKHVAYLERVRKMDIESFKKDMHYIQVAKILGRFGFARDDFDPNSVTQPLSEWADQMGEVTNTVHIADWIMNETVKKRYRDMTPVELQDVRNAVENIRHVANMENKAFGLSQQLDIDEIAQKLVESAYAAVPESKRYKPGLEPERFESLKSWGRGYILSLKRPGQIFHLLNGYKDNGPWTEFIERPVYESDNKESGLTQTLRDMTEKLWEPYSKAERKKMANDLIYIPEIKDSVTKMRLFQMALNVGNAGNKQRLFDNQPVGIRTDVAWNEAVGMKILQDHFDERDWRTIQAHWDMVNTLWPEIAALHKELTGFEPEKVQALPFTARTTDGKTLELPGGYYPLKEDTRASGRAILREAIETPLYEEKNLAWKAATRQGHTKKRAGEASYAVSLDVSITDRHIRDAIHDIAFRRVVIDLRRILAKTEVQEALIKTLGKEGYKYVKEWSNVVASGNANQDQVTGALGKIVDFFRRQTVKAGLVWRVSTVLQNFCNPILYPGAVEGFGYKEAMRAYFMRGLYGYMADGLFRQELVAPRIEEIKKKSQFMADKELNPDYSLAEARRSLFGSQSKLGEVQEFGAAMLSWTDNFTNVPMWEEAYALELERNGGDEKGAVFYADNLIKRVTGSSRKTDIAPIQRGNVFERSLAMFYSFLNAEFNRWATEYGIASLGGAKEKAHFPGFVAARVVFFQLASSIVSGKGPGDDEDWAVWALREMTGGFVGMFPGFRDVTMVAFDEVIGKHTFGYRPSPAIAPIEAAINLVKTSKKAADGKAEPQQWAEAATKAAAYTAGYPDQWNAWFWNAYDYWNSGMTPQMSDVYRRRPKSERQ